MCVCACDVESVCMKNKLYGGQEGPGSQSKSSEGRIITVQLIPLVLEIVKRCSRQAASFTMRNENLLHIESLVQRRRLCWWANTITRSGELNYSENSAVLIISDHFDIFVLFVLWGISGQCSVPTLCFTLENTLADLGTISDNRIESRSIMWEASTLPTQCIMALPLWLLLNWSLRFHSEKVPDTLL